MQLQQQWLNSLKTYESGKDLYLLLEVFTKIEKYLQAVRDV